MSSISKDTTELIAAVQAGNEVEFDQLVAPFSRELHAHCYRGATSAPPTSTAAVYVSYSTTTPAVESLI